MNYIQIPDYVYERILKTLQQGVDVCYNVDYYAETTEQSPSYANGYSRATMQSVIEDLNYWKSSIN
jgi:hypothetical protein